MPKLLQITDIHLNGDYNGKFDVKGHFEKILADNRNIDYDAVVLTGDLADDGSIDDYVMIFTRIMDTFGFSIPILVTPGNHDNRENLQRAYEEYLAAHREFKNKAVICQRDTFMNPGASIVVLDIIDAVGTTYHLISMDTGHKDIPYEGVENLVKMSFFISDVNCLFTHMPLIRPFHRFMNGDAYSIAEAKAKMFLRATVSLDFKGIFCGHYHCASVDTFDKWTQYVAPASQCQLDPFSTECVPSGNYPGYAVIKIFAESAAKFHYITEVSVEKAN